MKIVKLKNKVLQTFYKPTRQKAAVVTRIFTEERIKAIDEFESELEDTISLRKLTKGGRKKEKDESK